MVTSVVLNEHSLPLFVGSEDQVVAFLEERLDNKETGPLWVHIRATGDILTASQYLDLAT